VQLAVPNLFVPVEKLRWPVEFTAGATANRLAPELQLTVNARGSDSPGPEEMLVAQAALYAPESSATVTAAPAAKEGGSFTASAERQQQQSIHADGHIAENRSRLQH
jgi:hypothetical protein